MTVVLVHGNPETDAVWGPLVAELDRTGTGRGRDVIRLSPPGWGAPLPDGWRATIEEYRAWLVGELETIGYPVDLVGHDLGGAHVAHVAMTRPDLLRTWYCDVLGYYEPGYVWHDLAQVWQTPARGRRPSRRWSPVPRGSRAGWCPSACAPTSRRQWRRATRRTWPVASSGSTATPPPLARIGERLPAAAARPGLAVHATEDHFTGTEKTRRRAASRAGARFAVMEGVGHWWTAQDPARGAAMLRDFWDSVG